MAFQVCSHCAAALVNADPTGLEVEVIARIESMGLVTMTETTDAGTWFDCEVCAQTCIGEICTFEPV